MIRAMLTTEDNPHSPFDDYDAWYTFDRQHGYNTPSFLARFVVSSEELSDPDQALAIEQAIDEIVYYNVLGIYKKVTQEVPEDFSYSE